jgi:hypothetical protein
VTNDEIVNELYRLRSMGGGALYNELTELGEQIKADELATAPEGPPVVRDVPYAQEEGTMLTCTMGNWENEPSGYAYAWTRDGLPAGSGAEHLASAGVWACTVTATNAKGSASSTSNEVTVE